MNSNRDYEVILKSGRNCNVYCCVYGCNSRGKKNRELSFHLFPKKGFHRVPIEKENGTLELVDLQKVWIINLKMGKPPSKFMKVCSLRFKPDDFWFPNTPRKKRILKTNAVPTCNLPITSLEKKLNVKKKTRRTLIRNGDLHLQQTSANQKDVQINQLDECVHQPDNSCDNPEPQPCRSSDEMEVADILCSMQQSVPRITTVDASVQVNTDNFQYNFVDGFDSDSKVCAITGLSTLKLLNTLTQLVDNEISGNKNKFKMGVKSRVVMTFMKIKTNLSYVILAIIFHLIVTPTMCREIFRDTIGFLASILKPCVPFLSTNDINMHKPKCFSDFPSVRIVLDCTEIYVQKLKCLCCNLKLYSTYYHSTTVKFMVGVAPSGLITFVSLACGGRTSDKAIFEQSGLIEKLIPGKDQVMVDKGFLIDDLSNVFNIKVIRPPFLRKQSQFSFDDARITRKIARARIHIERVNQRIKIFKMLSSTLSTKQVIDIDKIFFVVCAITNLSAPVLAEDKFMK